MDTGTSKSEPVQRATWDIPMATGNRPPLPGEPLQKKNCTGDGSVAKPLSYAPDDEGDEQMGVASNPYSIPELAKVLPPNCGLTPVYCEPDGNCLFGAVAECLKAQGRTPSTAAGVRAELQDHAVKQIATFESFWTLLLPDGSMGDNFKTRRRGNYQMWGKPEARGMIISGSQNHIVK